MKPLRFQLIFGVLGLLIALTPWWLQDAARSLLPDQETGAEESLGLGDLVMAEKLDAQLRAQFRFFQFKEEVIGELERGRMSLAEATRAVHAAAVLADHPRRLAWFRKGVELMGQYSGGTDSEIVARHLLGHGLTRIRGAARELPVHRVLGRRVGHRRARRSRRVQCSVVMLVLAKHSLHVQLSRLLPER